MNWMKKFAMLDTFLLVLYSVWDQNVYYALMAIVTKLVHISLILEEK